MNKVLAAVVAVFGLSGVLLYTASKQDQPESVTQTQATCEEPLVKGNISMSTGEKIYHVPGDRFYSATVIEESEGEQWFCTEGEAVEAGWRHSER